MGDGSRSDSGDTEARRALMGRAAPGLSISSAERKRFGAYEIIASIGRGGMGEIYLARFSRRGRTQLAALKVLNSKGDDDLVRMFMDEASIMAQIDSPHVLEVFDFGKDDSAFFLAMEYLQGRPLVALMVDAYQRGRGLDYGMVAAIGAGAARGLADAHETKSREGKALQVIHRDISPQNIFLTYAGVPKVIDFGVARASERLAQTVVGQIKGKAAYMSPEQVEGSRKLDARSDVFSLGVCLWEMAAGRRLFKRDSDYETMLAVTEGPLVAPSKVRRRPEPEIDGIIMSALRRPLDQRTRSARELAVQLEAYATKSIGQPGEQIRELMKELYGSEAEEERTLIRALEGRHDLATSLETENLRRLSGISPRPEVAEVRHVTFAGRVEDLSVLDSFGDPEIEEAQTVLVSPPRARMDSVVPKLSVDQRSEAVQNAIRSLQTQYQLDQKTKDALASAPSGPASSPRARAAGRWLARSAIAIMLATGGAAIGLLALNPPPQRPGPTHADPPSSSAQRVEPIAIAPTPERPVPLDRQEVLRAIEAHEIEVEVSEGMYRLRSNEASPWVMTSWEMELRKIEAAGLRGFLLHSREPRAVSAVFVGGPPEGDWSVTPISINDCDVDVAIQPIGFELSYGDRRVVVPHAGSGLHSVELSVPRFVDRLELLPLGLSFGEADPDRPTVHCSGFTDRRMRIERVPEGEYSLRWSGRGREETVPLVVSAESPEVIGADRRKGRKRPKRPRKVR